MKFVNLVNIYKIDLKYQVLVKMLVNKSGVRAEILTSGSLSVGDVIKIIKIIIPKYQRSFLFFQESKQIED